MNLNLDNKVVIVSGGSKGIGLGIVDSLIKENAIPFIIGRDEKSIKKVVNRYKSVDREISYSIAELSNPNECEKRICTNRFNVW